MRRVLMCGVTVWNVYAQGLIHDARTHRRRAHTTQDARTHTHDARTHRTRAHTHDARTHTGRAHTQQTQDARTHTHVALDVTF